MGVGFKGGVITLQPVGSGHSGEECGRMDGRLVVFSRYVKILGIKVAELLKVFRDLSMCKSSLNSELLYRNWKCQWDLVKVHTCTSTG